MIYLNIYDFKILIKSSHPAIDARIKLEFDFFIKDHFSVQDLTITFEFKSNFSVSEILPINLTPTFQRNNSITYDTQDVRWNDYYGFVLSHFELKKKQAHFIGKDLDKLYEVIFLFILSRSGKKLDLDGKHKIHAFSFAKNNKALVCMQPMRGGKSTLLSEILQKWDVSIISDDTPIVNHNGELIPFPLRMSLENLPTDLDLDVKDYFLLKREFYKPKFSMSLKVFNRKIASQISDFILIEAKRSTFTSPQVIKNGPFTTFKYLFKHMVIGIGLPIIFEYFWENGFYDFIIKCKIFLSRLTLAIKLSFSRESYTIYLCDDVQKNAQEIVNLLDN